GTMTPLFSTRLLLTMLIVAAPPPESWAPALTVTVTLLEPAAAMTATGSGLGRLVVQATIVPLTGAWLSQAARAGEDATEAAAKASHDAPASKRLRCADRTRGSTLGASR